MVDDIAALAPDPAIVAAQAEVDAVEAARVATLASDTAATDTATAARDEKGRFVPATPAAPVVPEKYEYTLPDGLTADAAIVERTTAIARELGLGNDAAQKLLDREVAAMSESETQRAALIEAWKPGGTEFVKRDQAWQADALADKDLGAGDPAKFAVHVEKAQQALQKFGPELKDYLNSTGLGSHPAAIKFLARVGSAMSEGALVVGSIGGAGKPKTDAEIMYPNHARASA